MLEVVTVVDFKLPVVSQTAWETPECLRIRSHEPACHWRTSLLTIPTFENCMLCMHGWIYFQSRFIYLFIYLFI